MSEFIVIGISDSRKSWFPPEVEKEIRNGHVFSGGRRHHDIVRKILPHGAVWIDITVPIDDVFGKYAAYDCPIVVFASGDPLFFGFANTIRRTLPQARIRLFPSFNSLQTLAHRMVLPYHDMRTVSLTGRPWHEFDRAMIECEPKIGVLTDREHTPAAIARRMTDYGYTDYYMTVGENLGNEERETVTRLSLNGAADRDFAQPNCLILTATATHSRRTGIPDREFEHLDGRGRMITKMPIRLLSLQALGLAARHTLWDIGFCTGSVSIEARLSYPHLHVVAFEIRPEGERLMEVNSRRFGAPGIIPVIGDFLTADLDSLPSPDAVFIGGHGGRLADIMQRVADVLQPDGVIVMNSVTPQSRTTFLSTADGLGMTTDEPLHIALNDYNPIDILTARKAGL